MHKNTCLTAFLAVIAALLIGFNLGRTIPIKYQQCTYTDRFPTPTFAIVGAACGAFQYPNTLPGAHKRHGVCRYHQPGYVQIVICQQDIPEVPCRRIKLNP